MQKIRTAVVGAGFIGPVHVEALERIGVEVTGILGVSKEESERAAKTLGLPKAYTSFEEMLADQSVQVGAHRHAEPAALSMAKAALNAGKHVMCEKPLAMNSTRVGGAGRAGQAQRLAAGVNYNIRFYPLNLEARDMMRRGDSGRIFSVGGSYVQDWLFYPTDYNWRVLAEEGGELRAVADIGTHWLDLVHAITGLEVEAVCADLTTVHPVRQRPKGEVETFKGKQEKAAVKTEPVKITTEDYGCILLRFQGRGTGLPVGVAGDGGAQELPALRDRRLEAGAGLGQRAAQRAVDRPPRQAQREPDSRPVAGRPTRPGGSSTIPAGTTRASRTRSSSASGRSTTTSRRGTSRRRRHSPPSPTATARSCSARPF